jgi:D-serine deaminase-like pyridoxal phosphate-dependent protein
MTWCATSGWRRKTGALPDRYPPRLLYHPRSGDLRYRAKALIARDPIACDLGGDLTSALELMAMVQSVPEADRAVVNFGSATAPRRRAAAADRPLSQRRAAAAAGIESVDHGSALYAAPARSDVQVGDILVFGTSHPCLTFDKWKPCCAGGRAV